MLHTVLHMKQTSSHESTVGPPILISFTPYFLAVYRRRNIPLTTVYTNYIVKYSAIVLFSMYTHSIMISFTLYMSDTS